MIKILKPFRELIVKEKSDISKLLTEEEYKLLTKSIVEYIKVVERS